jgi:crotonobetainyl-CoA:carnitine CoA-transferase CaiB-like acyl-CoA transferase
MLKVAYIRPESPVRKPSKRQERAQQVEDLARVFAANHFERSLAKELERRGISLAQYEAMKEAAEDRPRITY